jgi:hypothetical protein
MSPQSRIEAVVGDGSSSSSASSLSPSSYLIDHLRFMREQETHYRINPDCLSAPGATVTPDDRRVMCSWSYQIVDSCSVDRSVAVIGMSYLDRFMCTSSPRAATALASRREYQLAVVSCLVIALKCRGGIKVGMGFVADAVCQGLYGADELEAMEMEVLRALTWRLSGPSPHDFVDAIVGLLTPSSSHSDHPGASSLVLSARAHVEAAALDHTMAAQPSSSLAYAALLMSLRKTEFLDGIRPAELFAWTHKLAGIACGKMGRVFVHELADEARRRWFASMALSPPPSPVLVDGVGDVHGRAGTPKSAIGAYRESKLDGATYCCIETSSTSTTSSTRTHESGEDDCSIGGPCSLGVLALGY